MNRPDRKKIWRAGAAALAVSLLLTGLPHAGAKASNDVTVDSARAGIMVPLNRFFASTMDPEGDLLRFLESGALTAQEPETEPETEAETQPVRRSAYENIAISRVESNVNVRKAPSTDAEVVGHIGNDAAAEILETVEGEGGEWYKIRSGNVQGYMKASYFVTGEEAEAIAKKVGTVLGKVKASALRLRKAPSTDAETLTVLGKGEEYVIIEEGIQGTGGPFVKIGFDEVEEGQFSTVGYLASKYVSVRVEFNEARTLAEERAEREEKERLAREAREAEEALLAAQRQKEEEDASRAEASRRARESEEAAARAAEESRQAQAAYEASVAASIAARESEEAAASEAAQSTEAGQTPADGTQAPGGDVSTEAPKTTEAPRTTEAPKPTDAPKPTETTRKEEDSDPDHMLLRQAMVAYAKQFLGNKYVFGGNSLTDGIDCSGFVQQIYAHFGYSIPRVSRDQASSSKGKAITAEQLLPGDLIFFADSSGTVTHVAMYIGNWEIIHAANSRQGIIISSLQYRSPCKYVRYIK